MDLFTPDPEEVTSPTFHPDDLTSISEDMKEESVFHEAPPIQVRKPNLASNPSSVFCYMEMLITSLLFQIFFKAVVL